VNKLQLNEKQREFITHTFIYYELGECLMSDSEYDRQALELEELKTTKLWNESKFKVFFQDWTSATGISLIHKDKPGYLCYYHHFIDKANELVMRQ
jgi:hypothetical protein